MANQYYWIDALAPLVFRSGKPFGSQSDTEDIVFPLPSSAAGLLRTTWAQQQDDFSGQFNASALQEIALQGLFLAQKNDDDNSGSLKLFAPKPADCLYLKNKKTDQIELVRLAPQDLAANCGCDLPHAGLQPVQMEKDIKGKPQGGKTFWALDDYFAWLNGENPTFKKVNENGVSLLTPDVRTHVAIDSQTQTGKDGLLFQTAAYDMANPRKAHHEGWENTRLGFVLASECVVKNDLVRFGGESRLSHFQTVTVPQNAFRQPEIKGKQIKLALLTPAIFAQGWLPKWLNPQDLTGNLPHTNLKVKLKAVAAERWLPVSGWDLAERKPKAMRKAVAAGSVYWFEVLDNPANLNEELGKLAYQSVCDDEQDKRDGFGICAVSEWTNDGHSKLK